MSKTLKIVPSIKEIISRIKAVIDDPASRRRVLIKAVAELKERAQKYPDPGAYNFEPGSNKSGTWYHRNWGTRYRKKDGTFGGKTTSQRLQKNWFTEVQRKDEFTASAFTEVTYAPFLLDPVRRVHWAAGHGWQSLDEIETDYMPRFEKIILNEIDKQVEKI